VLRYIEGEAFRDRHGVTNLTGGDQEAIGARARRAQEHAIGFRSHGFCRGCKSGPARYRRGPIHQGWPIELWRNWRPGALCLQIGSKTKQSSGPHGNGVAMVVTRGHVGMVTIWWLIPSDPAVTAAKSFIPSSPPSTAEPRFRSTAIGNARSNFETNASLEGARPECCLKRTKGRASTCVASLATKSASEPKDHPTSSGIRYHAFRGARETGEFCPRRAA